MTVQTPLCFFILYSSLLSIETLLSLLLILQRVSNHVALFFSPFYFVLLTPTFPFTIFPIFLAYHLLAYPSLLSMVSSIHSPLVYPRNSNQKQTPSKLTFFSFKHNIHFMPFNPLVHLFISKSNKSKQLPLHSFLSLSTTVCRQQGKQNPRRCSRKMVVQK